MPDYRLKINEPFTGSSHPVIFNEIHALDFMPATALSGVGSPARTAGLRYWWCSPKGPECRNLLCKRWL